MATSKGSVTRQRGKWKARVSIAGERRYLGLFETRAEAEAIVEEAIAAARGKVDAALTLGEWGEQWLERRELMGVRDAKNERCRWARYVASHAIADMALKSVKPWSVQKWVDDIVFAEATGYRGKGNRVGLGRPISRATAVHALKVLRGALEGAVGRYIAENPARSAKVPKRPSSDDKWTYLSASEIRDVLECEDIRPRSRDIFCIAIFTGLRAGELWGLRWQDVTLDGERPHVVVRHSFDGPTKSGRIRQVPLLPPAREALRRHKLREPGIGAARVFTSEDTGEPHCHGYDAGWKKYRVRAGIARRVRFHDLRHTCASHLVMGTWGRAWRLEEVREWLGHSTIKVTERYAHLSPESIHQAAKEMGATWTTVL